MVTLFQIVYWAHWGGLALILVGYLMSFASGVISPIMVWGARLQFLLGLGLVAVWEIGDLGTLNHMWVGVKLIVALAIVALCEVASSRAAKGRNNPLFMHLAAALVLVNTAYAWFMS